MRKCITAYVLKGNLESILGEEQEAISSFKRASACSLVN